uniref:Cytochrome P450 n=1 Tax=Timema tahoe TaxID=61484 RepID=A0A7R9ILF0_9NEOP|nr:unnamed protein product [Timema tahoe]
MYVGARFGMMSVKCCLTHIWAEFEISNCPETPFPLKFDQRALFLTSIGKIPLTFKRISTA